MEFFVRRMAEYLNYTNPHFRPSSRNPPRTIHEAPSREGQPENYQQLTINLHLNRTRQYGQSIVNAILHKPFRAGRVNLKEQQQQNEKKKDQR